jgi:hypothetical protein
MYLILQPSHSPISGTKHRHYQSFFVDDINLVSQQIDEPGTIVYKLDSLTQLKDVEVTYQEITEETKDE